MHTRSTILGFAVLTVLLTAGTAQSLSGSNTVFTDDIAPGNVTFSDIRENAVTSSRIANGGVFSGDVADNSLTGADINEATIPGFRRVYFARVSSTGALVDGHATSASKNVGLGGQYEVVFPFSVASCSATASSASGFGSSFTVAVMTSTAVNGSVVTVYTRNHDGGAATTGFTLTLVCP